MMTIRTFLRSGDGVFQPVGECQVPPPDPDYIEGALEITIDGVEIIGKPEWDYVDQLWAYLATMVGQLRASGEATTYLPDQPIELSLTASDGLVRVASLVGGQVRAGLVDEVEFLATVRAEGRAAFTELTRLAAVNAASYRLSLADLAD